MAKYWLVTGARAFLGDLVTGALVFLIYLVLSLLISPLQQPQNIQIGLWIIALLIHFSARGFVYQMLFGWE